MKKVDNAEVAGNGAESQEHGPFVEQEYKQGIRIVEANENYEERLFKSGIFRTQYNVGGRIDDASTQGNKLKNWMIHSGVVLHSWNHV